MRDILFNAPNQFAILETFYPIPKILAQRMQGMNQGLAGGVFLPDWKKKAVTLNFSPLNALSSR